MIVRSVDGIDNEGSVNTIRIVSYTLVQPRRGPMEII